MRAFVGLLVPKAWIGPVIRAQGRIAGGHKVGADDLHMTLAFVDDLPRERFRLHVMLVRFAALVSGDPSGLPGVLAAIGPPVLEAAPARQVIPRSSTPTSEGPVYKPLVSYTRRAA